MTTFPDFAFQLSKLIVSGEGDFRHPRTRAIVLQAIAKFETENKADKAAKLRALIDQAERNRMIPIPVNSRFWRNVEESRSPWTPDDVTAQVDKWLREMNAASVLAAAGERVRPLLLVGETRCGKTSSVCRIARDRDVPVYQMNLQTIVQSHMGETAGLLTQAFDEMARNVGCVWLLDEVDSVAAARGNGSPLEKDMAHTVNVLLTLMDRAPAETKMVATTNRVDAIDSAVLGRFDVIEWPRWDGLSAESRRLFAASHGAENSTADSEHSYASCVRRARDQRVARILESAEARR